MKVICNYIEDYDKIIVTDFGEDEVGQFIDTFPNVKRHYFFAELGPMKDDVVVHIYQEIGIGSLYMVTEIYDEERAQVGAVAFPDHIYYFPAPEDVIPKEPIQSEEQ